MSDQPGPELDRKVAKALGISVGQQCCGKTQDAANGSAWSCSVCGYYDDHDPGDAHIAVPRRFSTDWSAAMLAAEEFGLINMGNVALAKTDAGRWAVMVFKMSDSKEWWEYWQIADTGPHAICLAILKLAGEKP